MSLDLRTFAVREPSKIKIESDERGSTQVWVDGVRQERLLDIEITFGIAGEPNRLKLTHLAEQVEVAAFAYVEHVCRCGYCGAEKQE